VGVAGEGGSAPTAGPYAGDRRGCSDDDDDWRSLDVGRDQCGASAAGRAWWLGGRGTTEGSRGPMRPAGLISEQPRPCWRLGSSAGSHGSHEEGSRIAGGWARQQEVGEGKGIEQQPGSFLL